MNEVGLNAKWLGKDLTDPDTQKFTQDVLNHMRERLSDYQEMYGDLYNLEATPAESTAFRLAMKDVERFPDIRTAAKEGETPYYTNSSHLPVGYTEDIFSALDIQDDLQTLYTSGTVFHAFLGEKLPDWKAAANLVRKIAENYKLPYYTMSPTYSICQEHGYLSGEHPTCPTCGKACEVWSRITGYYRPVQNWNDGKVQEYKHRKEYNIENSRLTHVGVLHPDANCRPAEQLQIEISAAPAPSKRLILFTTRTCPNCNIAKAQLEKNGVQYDTILAEENAELAKKYGIMQAPTLVLVEGDSFTPYVGVPGVIKYLNNK